MCSLHLTHPRTHPLEQWETNIAAPREQLGVRLGVRVSPQSWTLPARAGIRTHNLGLPRVSSPTLYPLGHDCPRAPLISTHHVNERKQSQSTSLSGAREGEAVSGEMCGVVE